MPELLIPCLRSALIALTVFQIAILAIRFRSCPGKIELAWFAMLLLLIGALSFTRHFPLLQTAVSFTLLWALGGYLYQISRQERIGLWHGTMAGIGFLILILWVMGFYGTLPSALLLVFILWLAAVFPLRILHRLFRSGKSRAFFFLLLCSALLILTMGYDLLDQVEALPELRITIWVSLLYIIGTAYMLTQEAYLMSASMQGLVYRLSEQERKLKSAYSRLIQTENTLMLQDRLIAAGLLAAGAAHEFKNTLSSIQASAEYGFIRQEVICKNRALRMILENTKLGRQAILAFLDNLVDKGREHPRPLRLKDSLRGLLGIVRAAYRRQGIRVQIDMDENLVLTVRKGELEQVLLNLIRNAVDCLNEKTGTEGKLLCLRAWEKEEELIFDVIDNGGGVPVELGARIFDPSISQKDSTGLGLFLAEMLVSRNGGRLEYIPVQGGSCFRMTFPGSLRPLE